MRFLEHFMTAPIASGWSKIAGWVSHPLENAASARRTPEPAFRTNENGDQRMNEGCRLRKVKLSSDFLTSGYANHTGPISLAFTFCELTLASTS